MTDQRITARRTFLRQAVTMLAAGIGVVLLPGVAQASQVTCCPSNNCPTCSGPDKRFRCQGTCPTYCTCHSDTGGNCYTIPC